MKIYTREHIPHTLISCGTGLTEKTPASVQKHVKALVERAVGSFPNETSNTRMVGGSPRVVQKSHSVYNPHNYKLYLTFSKISFHPDFINPTSGTSGTSGMRSINSGSEFVLDDFHGCRVVVKKHTLEIYNRTMSGRWWRVVNSPVGARLAQVKSIIEEIDADCLRVAGLFIGAFGGSFGEVVRVTCENKVLDEDLNNRIPLEMKFHSNVAKKVYDDSSVEFKTPVEAATALENAALMEYAPVIARELESLRKEIMTANVQKPFVSSLESIKLSVVCFPDDVFACCGDIVALSDFDKACLTDWFFVEFGGLRV